MEVRVIGVTQPGTIGEFGNYFDPNIKTPEDIVVYCARVSNPKNQANMDTGAKLLSYMIKHQHWSPFEMVNLTLEITTTRDIARQILRHRSFSFQEFSQRYAKVTEVYFREARLQDSKNRQNSLEIDDIDLQAEWFDKQNKVIEMVRDIQTWAEKNNLAKEVTRAILPEGLTGSRLYMQGSLRSWIHYCILRKGLETQKEHREIAEMCWERIKESFPATVEAVEKNLNDKN